MSRRAPAVAEQDGRDRILAVAIRSFSEIGYEGTTTAGIAREAGVTQPLIHHHFGSKQGLWEVAMERLFSDLPMLTVAPGESPAERLVAGAEQFARFAAAHPEVTRIMAREGAAPSPRLTHLIERYLRVPMQQMVAAIRAGQRAGSIGADLRPELLLFFVLGAGSHVFDVTAFAQESLGVDVRVRKHRDEFVTLVGSVLRSGIFRAARAATGRTGRRGRRD